jgi:tRNA threonylcarbamoyladenosine biosynthesis protein TsaE
MTVVHSIRARDIDANTNAKIAYIKEYLEISEYFSKDGIVVCEWPNNVSEIIPDEYLLIEIFRTLDDGRRFELTPHGKRYEKLVGDLNA